MTDEVQPIGEGQVADAEVTHQEPALEQPQEQSEQQAEQKPELSEAERELRRERRKREKAERNNYKLHAELEQLRQSAPRQEQTEQTQQPSEEQIRELARKQVEVERLNARCDDIVAEGMKKFKGFDNAVKVIQEEAPLFDGKGAPTALLEAVLDADKPAELLHHLGSNPDLAAELADLSPIRQAKRIAIIEQQMREAKKPSGAPKPLEPVKQVATPTTDPDKMTTEEWLKWRQAQLKRA